MRNDRIIIDTGPLVVMLNRRDSQHAACRTQSLERARPFLTTWPVVAEAAWLLRHTDRGVSELIRLISDGLLDCYSLRADAADWMDAFLRRYSDQAPQLADSSLMFVAERENLSTIFTLDRRDFLVYKLANNQPLELLPEA